MQVFLFFLPNACLIPSGEHSGWKHSAMFTGKILHLIPWKCKRRTWGIFVFVVLTSELLVCCWAVSEFELEIPCWISLWGSSPAGGPGNQGNIKSKSRGQWCCCGCSSAVPTLWGMWAPETPPDAGLATSQGTGYSWGWSPCSGSLTLHPWQGRFYCFCSSFWAGRHLSAQMWSSFSLSAFHLCGEGRELPLRAQFCLQKV